jgi:hypothetical protein
MPVDRVWNEPLITADNEVRNGLVPFALVFPCRPRRLDLVGYVSLATGG